jgi:beta-lactamase superfamily II metal-dependent hydrolase
MVFVVLDVGQGTGNFVEFLDDGGQTVSTMLIDLGSEGWKRIAGGPSADFVAKELQTMPSPTIDAVFLSHSDSDHVNLLKRLLEHFDPPSKKNPTKPVLTVNHVWYGGDAGYYKKGKTNYLTLVDGYRPKGSGSILTACTPNATSFAGVDTSKWVPMFTVGAAKVWLLAGNTTAEQVQLYKKSKTGTKAPEAYAINTKSLVLLVTYDNSQIVVTGDATGMTLAKCNEILEQAGVPKYLNDVFSLTLPHHGSDTTTYSLLGATGKKRGREELAEENVRDFVANVKPKTISASAGERSTFRHPSSRVIDDFSSYLTKTVYFEDSVLAAQHEHFYTAFFAAHAKKLKGGTASDWPSKSGWYTARTQANVFSTDYYNGLQADPDFVVFPPVPAVYNTLTWASTPPRAVAWGFTLEPGKPRQITEIFRRSDLAAMAEEDVIALIGRPLPPPEEEFVWGRTAATVPPPTGARPSGAEPVRDEPPPTRGGPLDGLRQVP